MSIPQFAVWYNFFVSETNFQKEVFMVYRRIRDLREDRDITQNEISKALNCSQRVYSNYELGQRDIPTDILIKLAIFHDVSVDYLLGISDVKERR